MKSEAMQGEIIRAHQRNDSDEKWFKSIDSWKSIQNRRLHMKQQPFQLRTELSKYKKKRLNGRRWKLTIGYPTVLWTFWIHTYNVTRKSLLIFELVTPAAAASPSLSRILYLYQLSISTIISAWKFNCYTIFKSMCKELSKYCFKKIWVTERV